MGKWEEAAGHFEAALASQARTQALAWLARTRYDFARLLLVRGKHPDRERASGLLVAALEAAHQIGMPRLVEQVAALQAAEAQGQVTPAYPDGLTGREVEVLRLIAAGHTTREIAAELVVTVGTVERHITNLYGKIGARGRADATAYALEHGLARPRHS
jgi:DNA-binding NarL/FixJ family response regulator